MIYQHRLVLAREGRLEKRHKAFQETALTALDGHGSTLIGAFEILIGDDAGCGVYQMRQFHSLADWEQHQDRVRADQTLADNRAVDLYPHLDHVTTAIVRMADGFAPLPSEWPGFDSVRGTPTGFVEQRILDFKPGTAAAHHRLYREAVLPALDRDGAELIGLFDTVIGPGTMNASSHRSIELRRFPNLRSWQTWREAQDHDDELRHLTKDTWLSRVLHVQSALLKPLDYSRIR